VIVIVIVIVIVTVVLILRLCLRYTPYNFNYSSIYGSNQEPSPSKRRIAFAEEDADDDLAAVDGHAR
jgi:hypothetical protein